MRITAENITGITGAADFHGGIEAGPAPTVEALIADIRQRLYSQIEKAQAHPAVQTTHRRYLARAKRKSDEFEAAVNNVPEGFKLTPVFYAKVSQEENDSVTREFGTRVRAGFLGFLADHHRDDLLQLGFSVHAVERMKRRLEPADKDRRYYDVSVDHIIEHSGGGYWAQKQEMDPDRPPRHTPKFRVNHFGNLVLLPMEVHKAKNTLNAVQKISALNPGEGRWVLMIIPECDTPVCPRQKAESAYQGLGYLPENAQTSLMRAAESGRDLYTSLMNFRHQRGIAEVLGPYFPSSIKGVRAFHAANDNRGLTEKFNNLMKDRNDLSHSLRHGLQPAIQQAKESLKEAFARAANVSQSQKRQRSLKNFAATFDSATISFLRSALSIVPNQKAKDFCKTCRVIDKQLAKRKISSPGRDRA